MALPSITHRAYQDDTDLHRLLDSLSRAHAGHATTALLHPGDLIWMLFQNTHTDPRRTIELWEAADDTLLGFGTFEGGDFDTQWFPREGEHADERADAQRLAFETEALTLARERARQTGASQLRTSVLAGDTLRRDLLTAAAFAPDDTRVTRRGERNTGILLLWQALDAAAAEQAPSSDFFTRPVGEAVEWPARVALHRTVWAPSRVTLAAYRRLRAAPVYRPDLDLVAVAPNGTFAAYAIVWYDPASRVGEFEPVGTHPGFRRQGAARAVMLEGLRRLRALGARRALVPSSADNPAAIGLYESVGFHVAERDQFYRAHLDPL